MRRGAEARALEDLRLTLVMDARSPTAQSWLRAVRSLGCRVQVLSTHALSEPPPACDDYDLLPTLPAVLSRLLRRRHGRLPSARRHISRTSWSVKRVSEADSLRGFVQREQRLCAELIFQPWFSNRLAASLERFRPQLVHALRMPYEGFLTALSLPKRHPAFIVSTWGNDLTLHALKSPTYRRLTRIVLRRAAAVHYDCAHDARLSRMLGFNGPAFIAPGSGGIDDTLFRDGSAQRARRLLGLSQDAIVILNPRGQRSYVRNDVFLAALPRVLAQFPTAVAVGVGLNESAAAVVQARLLGISDRVHLLGSCPPELMADLYRCAAVTVSPSTHDGTPNSLLEAMACGSFPVASDLPSIREWIDPPRNGLLFDANSPSSLREALIAALTTPDLLSSASRLNRTLVERRATKQAVAPVLVRLYSTSVASRVASDL